MRDRFGVERGLCTVCLPEEIECLEFVCRAPGHEEIDYSDAFVVGRPEDYAKDPVLACIRAKLGREQASRGNTPLTGACVAVSSDAAVCSTCGCPAESHEVIVLSPSEEHALATVQRLYASIDMQDCISQSVRDTMNLGFTRECFTYGEVGALSFLRLLDDMLARRGHGGAFYDLGCGVGKAVVLAGLHPIGFSRCVGVELLPGLCRIGRQLGLPIREEVASDIDIVQGDLFDLEIGDAALVLVNIGSWEEPNLSRLRRHLLRVLPDRCTLLTIRKRLALPGSADLLHLEEAQLPMSWGLAPVFVAERRREAVPSTTAVTPSRSLTALVVDLSSMD